MNDLSELYAQMPTNVVFCGFIPLQTAEITYRESSVQSTVMMLLFQYKWYNVGMILRSMWENKYVPWVKANIHELKRFIIFDPWLGIIARHSQ